MASPGSVVIQFLTDTAKASRDALGFAKTLGKVETAADGVDTGLDGAQRAIDETGDKARLSGTDLGKMETSLDQVGDEADRTADRLRADATQMVNAMSTADAGIDRETTSMTSNMGEAGSEAGTEFIGNLAEGIGSGEAKVSDVLQGTLGGLTNMISGLAGPWGIAAGLAAAAVGTGLSVVKGDAEKAKAALDGITGALEGLESAYGEIANAQVFQDWVTRTKETGRHMNDINDAVEIAGVSADDFRDAIAGDPKAYERVRDALADSGVNVWDAAEAGKIQWDTAKKYLDTVEFLTGELDSQAELTGTARRDFDAIAVLSGDAKSTTEDWTDEMYGVKRAAEGVNDELDDADGRTLNIELQYKAKNLPRHLGGTIPMSAAAPQTAAVVPATINVNVRGSMPDNPRQLVALLESHTVRMGRRRGAPRAVAW